jgi:adenine-specific DNA-methyltransferase
MRQEEKLSSSTYKHAQKSVQRPDVGVEAQFPNKKTPKAYRYDSSLAPELCWDENGERPFAEWLLNLVAEAAEKGEGVVFAKPQVWQGTEEKFSSLSQCAARLRSLTKPFLNWTGTRLNGNRFPCRRCRCWCMSGTPAVSGRHF